jgi:hypothetical protein
LSSEYKQKNKNIQSYLFILVLQASSLNVAAQGNLTPDSNKNIQNPVKFRMGERFEISSWLREIYWKFLFGVKLSLMKKGFGKTAVLTR